jgi:hypothetical protein
MTTEYWLSAFETIRRAREAGCTEGDLAQWAEAGKLRGKATRGRFSDDDYHDYDHVDGRLFKQPAKAHMNDHRRQRKSSSIEPWPFIPSEFWFYLNLNGSDATISWSAGAFGTTVRDEPTPDCPAGLSQYIKLSGVEFYIPDLDALLGDMPEPDPLLDNTPEAENLETKPKLPANAKRINQLFEEHAHFAAMFIQKTGAVRAEAFRQAVKEKGDLGKVVETAETQVRRTFDMMYSPDGSPIKKDQK